MEIFEANVTKVRKGR